MPVLKGLELYISKRVGRAITDYKMVAPEDRIAVGVSGGKDSLALLQVLLSRRRFVPVNYDIIALHVDLGYPKSIASFLEKYFKKIKVKYHIEKAGILKGTKKKDINCFWCAWNRRKALFEASNRLKCDKLALGHHKDDIAQTIMLNMFFQGEISAMSPKQSLFNGKITIIRPFVYVEERMIASYARKENLPFRALYCPNQASSNRVRMAKIIKELERFCPEVKTNILRSVKRIKKEYLL
ncbi:MAG: ATP-binding protein [Candidatus Omnitrophota bacterium]